MSRSCGPCRECCIVLDVTPIGKPANTPCRHLCARGCGIYEDRPNACREFTCGWLEGALPKSLRPDRTHVVCWSTMLIAPGGHQMTVLQANVRANFRRCRRTMRYVYRWSAVVPVVVVQGPTNELISRGRSVVRWHERDFIKLDEVDGRLVGRVVPRAEVIRNDRDEARWELAQRMTKTVLEPGELINAEEE